MGNPINLGLRGLQVRLALGHQRRLPITPLQLVLMDIPHTRPDRQYDS